MALLSNQLHWWYVYDYLYCNAGVREEPVTGASAASPLAPDDCSAAHLSHLIHDSIDDKLVKIKVGFPGRLHLYSDAKEASGEQSGLEYAGKAAQSDWQDSIEAVCNAETPRLGQRCSTLEAASRTGMIVTVPVAASKVRPCHPSLSISVSWSGLPHAQAEASSPSCG